MDERGFTGRALAIGVAIGSLGAVSNIYVSLKTGWSLPVMTTAAVVGLGVARVQGKPLRAPEAVVATALASATAFGTGGGNVAAFPALALLGGRVPGSFALFLWFAATALFGTLLAPLLGARVRGLRFPTATATATLVEEKGGGTARALWLASAGSAAFAIVRRLARVPPVLAAPGTLGAYTFGVETSLLLVAVGGLMTWTTAWSTLVGGLVTYGIVAPRLVAAGLAAASYRSLVAVMVWPAAALLVAAALAELALDARLLAGPRAANGLGRRDALFLLPGLVAALVARFVFDMAWPVVLASFPLAIAFAYVAARSMGETDVVPTRALAPLAQAIVGLVGRGVVGPTIAPNLAGATAMHAADTLGSMKLAAQLAVPDRVAIRARLAGSILGALVVAVAFGLIVPDVRVLPTSELPAPGVLVWKSVAEVIAAGQLPLAMRAPIAAGAVLGVVLTVLGRVLPARWRVYVPSAMGIGSGMVLPASMAFAIVLGGLLRRRAEARLGAAPAVAVASGAVAGESLVGVLSQLVG